MIQKSLLLGAVLCAFLRSSFGEVTFSDKSYSCVNNVCELNKRGIAGLGHGICLTTCGAGNIWPKPNGEVLIGAAYLPVNLSNIRIVGNLKSSALASKMEQNFLDSLKSLKTTEMLTNSISTFTVNFIVDDASITAPSIKNDESYNLQVSTTGAHDITVTIHGVTIFGVRHGLETLSQLISYDVFSKSLVIPTTVSISDKPVFPYRGVMVDVSRNFISVNKLKETVRAMGYNKMNVLHLHLSDSASFPLELKTQSNLTSYGAYDNKHYYSTQEVVDFVSFAHSHGVSILPEIDMPAHVAAGWQWGPEAGLGDLALCTDPEGTHGEQWAHDSLEPPSGQLNIANENVYPILGDIYSEIVSLFQSDFFHLGGDEVIVGSDEAWAACYNSTKLGQPILQQLEKLGLSRHDQSSFYTLWSDFTKRATSLVKDAYANNAAKEKKTGSSSSAPLSKIHLWGGAGTDAKGVTYNLMVQPDLTTTAPPELFTIQVWDTTKDTIVPTLISQGYDVILSNTDYVYLDCGTSGYTNPGGYWCQPYHEWYHIYQYIADVTVKWNLTADQLSHVLGSETLIWTEMVDDNNLSQKLWPRSAALAEALWSSNNEGWYAAAGRMLHWRELLAARGVAAEAMQPLWCSQRDPYSCNLNTDTPQ